MKSINIWGLWRLRIIKNKHSINILSILIIILLSPLSSSAADDFKPYLHKPSVGNVPKLETFGQYETELFPGAGTYSYEIKVPLGTRGLQPSVALIYNSQSALQRPGILGNGWSLAENYIMRNVNHPVDNADDDYFVLVLGDSRFKVFYNGTAFNTETDPKKLKIANFTNGDKQYWNVTSTDGTRYRFGFNSDSLLESNTGKGYDIKWSLDLVEDIHSNKIFYSYRENPFPGDNGTTYIANITYNNEKLRLIQLGYESQERPDKRMVYEQGNILDERRRLQNISVLYNASLVRLYRLGYITLNPEQTASAISNITYIGSDSSSILHTIKLEYFPAVQGFDNTTKRWVVPSAFSFASRSEIGKDFGIRLMDVNNDGFPDLVKAKASEAHATQLNNKVDGWDDSSTLVIPIDIVDASCFDLGVRFDDVNSDGLIDILRAKGGTARNVYLNNGTGWNITSIWSIPVDFIDNSSNDMGVELADVNADGKVDILNAKAGANAVYL